MHKLNIKLKEAFNRWKYFNIPIHDNKQNKQVKYIISVGYY